MNQLNLRDHATDSELRCTCSTPQQLRACHKAMTLAVPTAFSISPASAAVHGAMARPGRAFDSVIIDKLGMSGAVCSGATQFFDLFCKYEGCRCCSVLGLNPLAAQGNAATSRLDCW
jgi:hypothetical protein